jgi:2,4-dienoyl-CoA reductase-like NADH-dependent reductase (Old Yellow Enzyme family)
MTHSTLQNDLQPWAPSAIAPRDNNSFTKTPYEIPHEMTVDEIKQVV